MGNSCSSFLHRVMSVACLGCFQYKMYRPILWPSKGEQLKSNASEDRVIYRADTDSEESVRLAASPRRCRRCNGPGHRLDGKFKTRMFRKRTPPEEDACLEAMHYFDDDSSSGKTPTPPPLLRKGPEAPWRTTCSETDVTPSGSGPRVLPPCTCCPRAYPSRGRRDDCALTCQATCGDGAWTPGPGSDDETYKAVDTCRGWPIVKRVQASNARRSRVESRLKGADARRPVNRIKVDYGCQCSKKSNSMGMEERKQPNKTDAVKDIKLSVKSRTVEEGKQPNKSNVAEAIVQTSEPRVDGACHCETSSHSVAVQQRKPSEKSIAAEEQRQPSATIVESLPSTNEVVGASRRASQRSVADEERRLSNKSNVPEQRPSKTSRVDKSVDGCYCPPPKRSINEELEVSEKSVVDNRRSSNRSNVIEEKRPSSKDAMAVGQRSSLTSVKRSSREAAGGVE